MPLVLRIYIFVRTVSRYLTVRFGSEKKNRSVYLQLECHVLLLLDVITSYIYITSSNVRYAVSFGIAVILYILYIS